MKNARARRSVRWHRRCRPKQPTNHTAVIVPGSELEAITQWQDRAHRLPGGGMLLVVPRRNARLLEVSRRIRAQLDRQAAN